MGNAGNAMPAAVYEGRGVTRIVDRPVPTPSADQVLVEVGHCGICGSDLHLLVEGWGAPGTVAGHEYSGVIRALGSAVRGWSVGETVVGGPPAPCGRCRGCAAGKPSQCENRAGTTAEQDGGGFARYVAVDAGRLVRVPEELSPRTAALAEPLAVALHAITRAELSPGDTAMVFGAGPIGALAVAALVADGRYPVTVVEPNEGRRQLALGIGAVAALDPDALERYEPWEPERRSPHAVDAVLECSGKRAAIETAVDQLRRGGRLVLVGVGMERPRFDPNRLLLNELEIRGAFVYDADGFERALTLLASGAIPAAQLVEPDVPLDRLPEALTDLAAGKIAGKVMIVPRPEPESVAG